MTLGKRARTDEGDTDEESDVHRSKRVRGIKVDRLSLLSDELVLRVLSFLPVPSLATCQRLSSRFHTLAGDSQLWKSAYYNRFVRPRAARIPGIKDHNGQTVSTASLFYSSRISRWLNEDRLVKAGQETNWQRQYKLRHNWSRGSCDVQEIQIAETPSFPPMLVRLHEDVAFTADTDGGLRAWMMKGPQRLLTTLKFDSDNAEGRRTPTSLAIDATKNELDVLTLSIGFADGRFGIYSFCKQKHHLTCRYMHAASSNGIISAIAFASPYMLTMTEAQLLSLYRFPPKSQAENEAQKSDPPRLLSSLKSHTAWPPLSLSIRASSTSIVASIAYALPTYLSGWSVGLQELRLTPEGTVVHSRLTSAANQGFTPLFAPSTGTSTPATETESSPSRTPEIHAAPSLTKPTSLSYSHPYLLASHPDNTLTLYLAHSTETELTISAGSRLWGHTSSVSGAHVGDRGKAVSVSAHGEEIRVWELEGGLSSSSSRRRIAAGEASVQVRPEKRGSEDVDNALPAFFSHRARSRDALDSANLSTTKGWVGFDDEKVIVLRQKGKGTQALVVYDFS